MDHNKIIASAAKTALKPLGLKRVGKSRTWYDDHGWRAILVEFQPSGWSKGTYLNVGVTWFLYEKEHWTFDLDHRQDSFSSTRNADQFADVMERVSSLAIEKVAYYRNLVGTLDEACACYASRTHRSKWDHYHSAVLNALNGDHRTGREQFDAVLATPAEYQWQQGLHHRVRDLLRLLDSPETFRESIRGIVLRCRTGLNLGDIRPGDIEF